MAKMKTTASKSTTGRAIRAGAPQRQRQSTRSASPSIRPFLASGSKSSLARAQANNNTGAAKPTNTASRQGQATQSGTPTPPMVTPAPTPADGWIPVPIRSNRPNRQDRQSSSPPIRQGKFSSPHHGQSTPNRSGQGVPQRQGHRHPGCSPNNHHGSPKKSHRPPAPHPAPGILGQRLFTFYPNEHLVSRQTTR